MRLSIIIFITAILIGLGGGFALNKYAEGILFEALDDEVRASTPCHLVSRTWDVSLLTLSAEAKDAGIKCDDGTTPLTIPKITAKFNLKKIWKKKIVIDPLVLHKGSASGIFPGSPAYQFIARLSAPETIEQHNKDKFRVRLEELQVKNTTLSHTFKSGVLFGVKKAELKLTRSEEDNVTLLPILSEVTLNGIELADTIKAHILSTDFDSSITNLTIAGPNINFLGSLDIELTGQEKMKGNGDLKIALNPFLSKSEGMLLSSLSLDGSARGDIQILSNLQSEDGIISGTKISKLESNASLKITQNGDMTVFSDLISAQSGSIKGIDTSVLIDSSDKISGGNKILLSQSELFGVLVGAGSLNLSLQGSTDDPTIKINGSLKNISKSGVLIPEANLNVLVSDQNIDASFVTSDKSLKLTYNSLNGKEESNLELFNFKASNFITVSGQGSLDLKVPSINFDGKALFGETPLSIKANGDISNLSAQISGDGISGSLTTKNEKGVLKLSSQDFVFSPCKSITTGINYEFLVSSPLEGTGEMKPWTVMPSCNAEKISLTPNTPIPISDGKLNLNGRKITALNTDISLQGAVSLKDGLDVSLKGDADLSELLQGVANFDEIGGVISLNAKINGPFETPNIEGEIEINDGALEIETLSISAEGISGKANISNNLLSAENLSGVINGGTIRLEGNIPIFGDDFSKAKVVFSDVALEPSSDVSIIASGDLSFKDSELTGAITLDEGEVRKNFNLRTLISNTLSSIFKRELKYSTQSDIDLPLNLTVLVPNSILVQTNLFEATLEGALEVTGAVSDPNLKGKISFNDGWVGLRGRRFDINVGELTFSGGTSEPTLSVLGESVFLPSEQDSVSVVLQVEGPISAPKVSLSSDRNLTNQQLLNIITGGTSETELTQINARAGGLDLNDQFSIQDTVPFIPIPSFLRDLTRIDSLSIDPKYDPFTGQYEPVVTARKRLAPFLDLVGETSWQGTKNTAGVKAVYNLTPSVNVVGLARSLPTEDETVLGVDVTWTLLARQSSNTVFEINGNRTLDDREVYSAMNLSPFTVAYTDGLSLASQRLTTTYINLGKRSSSIKVSCQKESLKICKEIKVDISEGDTSLISSISFLGDELPKGIVQTTLEVGDIASTDNLTTATQEIVNKLRNEGYVGARVKSSYECAGSKCAVIFNISIGKPISFVFDGNKKFTAGDFLSSIRLFSRKQPFGRNTPSILQENIEMLYKNSGFPFVEVKREKTENLDGRLIYTFKIVEGIEPSINKVILNGYNSDTATLLDKIEIHSENPYRETFGISKANEDSLNRALFLLTKALELDGFERPDLTRSLEKVDEDSVNIIFTIQNTTRSTINSLEVVGFDFELPEKPLSPISSKATENYKKALLTTLESKGYTEAEASIDHLGSVSKITISQGKQLLIESISIQGLEHVKESTALDALKINPGEPLSDSILRAAQANLMKTGLFRRVNISRDGGKVNVTIEEKPLTTLEVGGGYSSGLGLHLFGEASDKKLFADGKTISLRLDGYMESWDGSLDQGIIATRFSEPSLFGSSWGLSSELSFQRQTLSTYEFDLNRLSLGTYAYRSWENGVTFSTGYTVFEENLKSVPTDAILSSLDEGNVFLGYASGSVTYDTRDYALNPSKGRIISFESMLSDKSLGSDAEYYGAGGRFAQYIPLTDRISFVAGGQIGKRWIFGDTEAPPISQRYYLGGRGSVRGYKENSLGPRGEDGSIIGGDELMRGNAEFHYRIYEDVSLQTFFDIGRISVDGVDSPLDEWAKGIGVGFRYLSPIGPIGLDFGHGLDDIPGSRDFRMTFDIGVSF